MFVQPQHRLAKNLAQAFRMNLNNFGNPLTFSAKLSGQNVRLSSILETRISYARVSQTLQPVTPKITVSETGDPHDPGGGI